MGRNCSQQSAATMSSTSEATKWSSAAQDGVCNTKVCCNEMTLPVLFKFSAYLEQTFDCRQSVCNKRIGKQKWFSDTKAFSVDKTVHQKINSICSTLHPFSKRPCMVVESTSKTDVMNGRTEDRILIDTLPRYSSYLNWRNFFMGYLKGYSVENNKTFKDPQQLW